MEPELREWLTRLEAKIDALTEQVTETAKIGSVFEQFGQQFGAMETPDTVPLLGS